MSSGYYTTGGGTTTRSGQSGTMCAYGVVISFFADAKCGAMVLAQNMSVFVVGLGWCIIRGYPTGLTVASHLAWDTCPLIFHADVNVCFPLYIQHAVVTLITAPAATGEL